MDGRVNPLPEDVKKMACPVLAHRIVLSPEARMSTRGITDEKVITRLISGLQVPVRVK